MKRRNIFIHMFGSKTEIKYLKFRKMLCKNKIGIHDFVREMKDMPLYYSTPLGTDRSGKEQLYFLSAKNSETKYYPAYLSKKGCNEHFNLLGRTNFIIIEGTLSALLSSLDDPMLSEFGVVIEPMSDTPIDIPPNINRSSAQN